MRKRFVFAISVIMVAVDQLLKWYAPVTPLPSGGGFFVRTLNHGIAFSLPLPSWLLAMLLAAGLTAVLMMAWREARKGGERVAPFVLVIAGAVSNIVDRVRVGAVIDYVSIPLIRLNFNLADCMIVAGVAIMIVKSLRKEY